jgi:hypothetical protein
MQIPTQRKGDVPVDALPDQRVGGPRPTVISLVKEPAAEQSVDLGGGVGGRQSATFVATSTRNGVPSTLAARK